MKKVESKNQHNSIKMLLSYSTHNWEQEYKKSIDSPDRALYVMLQEETYVGCLVIEWKNDYFCEVKHIAVSPSARGRGIGREMIDRLVDTCSFTYLGAETDQEAVDFYRKIGWKITSLGEKYPGVERFWCEYHREKE
ncbi:GNAT family N-acetyltransferase [Bacillus sp. KH172YL63]|uniref:GNAT family N-acetyltransferase n=1 Tax=Bacillus sp. KH172YL63 TaxID=2709784 RepID=UPI0013E503EF|nr:GNAT family N-acetyltransferase [Bacillus sp. KH172YL63]BCB04191.1 N-acetyltransferase [Bacillus sp. KH172YL63]